MATENLWASASSFDTECGHFTKRSMLINPKRIVFYLIFFLAFCLSGALTIAGLWMGFPYRMGLTSAFVIPLILIYGVRMTRVSVAYAMLFVIVLLSGLYNQSSLMDIVLFLRTLGFSYLMYALVDLYIRPHNITQVIRLSVVIAMLQLPVVLLQQLFWDQLPYVIKANVGIMDFDFGTFNFKCDASMAFFLTVLIVFMLFDKRGRVIGHRWFILPWLTVTVLIANAEAIKPVLILVWLLYFATHFRRKFAIAIFVILTIVFVALGVSGVLEDLWNDFTKYLPNNLIPSAGSRSAFLSGSYSRSAALAYYWEQGVSLLGDGPSAYYNVLDREYVLGNRGHFFTFYGEIGLLGWLASVAIFFIIGFFKERSIRYMRLTWVNFLSFLAIMTLSYTTEVMNDISIVLAYCLILKTHLIPPESSKLPRRKYLGFSHHFVEDAISK